MCERVRAVLVESVILHRFLRFSRRETIRIVRGVLQKERGLGWSLAIAFVDDRRMKRLNRRYLNHPWTTDVLSFADADTREAEVIVNLDQARRQAKTYMVSFSEETARLIIHGLLHALGYDDRTRRLREVMTQKEDLYLAQVYARTRR